jgi:prepilin-type N-terminal cleavage/methylation domain-containing protein/prepilin-type processing-associated H-X9-DG protein
MKIASRGFTLIELLVVIGIIAILLAFTMPALAKARRSAANAVALSNLKDLMHAYTMYANDHRGALLPGFMPPPTIPVYDPITKSMLTTTSARRWPHRLAQFNPALWKSIRPGVDVRQVSAETLGTYPVYGLNTVFLGGDASGMPATFAGGVGTFGGFLIGGTMTNSRVAASRITEVKQHSRQIVFVEARILNGSAMFEDDGTIRGSVRINPPRFNTEYWKAGPKNSIQFVGPTTSSSGIPYARSGSDLIGVAFLDGHVEALRPDQMLDMRMWTPKAKSPDWTVPP